MSKNLSACGGLFSCGGVPLSNRHSLGYTIRPPMTVLLYIDSPLLAEGVWGLREVGDEGGEVVELRSIFEGHGRPILVTPLTCVICHTNNLPLTLTL